MYILIDNETDIVLFLSDELLVLDEDGLHAPVRMFGVTPQTHTVVEGDGPDQAFVPGCMTFDGTWAIADQEAYDARVAMLFPPAPLPNLTMRKFRLGLLSAGLLDDVNAALAALPEPDRSVAKVEFEYAGEVVRTDPWVAALAGALGLMDAEIDALWTWAAGL